MLVPAILYKDEIIEEMRKYFYTDDMMYEVGELDNRVPDIADNPDRYTFQYAIVDDKKNLIGYLAYSVDWYDSCAYNFGLFSFDRGNVLVGRELFSKMEELVHKFHRVEWRMIGGNPVEKSYDKFCKKHNGTKHVLKDVFKDRSMKYKNFVIYEIVKGGGVDETV